MLKGLPSSKILWHIIFFFTNNSPTKYILQLCYPQKVDRLWITCYFFSNYSNKTFILAFISQVFKCYQLFITLYTVVLISQDKVILLT